jgi:hypothetical protein
MQGMGKERGSEGGKGHDTFFSLEKKDIKREGQQANYFPD